MKDKLQILTEKGEQVEALAPVIVSASRSTDIPAFYAQWFIHRLKVGYVIWYNPFNRQPMYISFNNTKVVVFWSKNPLPLIPLLKELDDRGIHYDFQFTMNDYDKEGFEPNVPPLQKRIETFKELSTLIGREKIIWRFDPLIVTPTLSPRDLLKKIWNIGNQIKGCTDKLVFSFIDIKAYRKVQRNMIKETKLFSKENIENAEFTEWQMHEIADGLAKIRTHWKQEGWELSLATCAEEIDLKPYGIEHNRCIDGELIKRISAGEINNLSFPKDKGQRKMCGCTISKDIGSYNTCSHFCIYCYANTSKEMVEKNRHAQSVPVTVL
ncbi:MAG: DUF1848 domain-containing protein [Tannerellaceae bacterium]|jgi:DNA repair photolyase|nr:DUF1848 domain-containing protein [Tannerellaceae bacterium]